MKNIVMNGQSSQGKRKFYISIDILHPLMKASKNPFVRSPTLDTVLMVEKTIEKYSGEFNRTQLWKKLPRKVMWQTYVLIIDYLLEINKIAVDRVGKIGWIWNPRLAKKFLSNPKLRAL